MTVVGIGAHKDTLAACAVDDVGRVLEHCSFANTPAGHAELVAVEGSGNCGCPAVRVLVGGGAEVRDAAVRMLRGDNSARARIKTLRALRRTITDLAADIAAALDATRSTLRDIDGVGDLVAADILAHTGDPTRFRTKTASAMANGTAPIQASSGRVQRHRLSRGANRQINKAIHTAAIAQIARPDTEGRRCHQRCHARGKTKREAIRNLKRRISDRIWTHLTADSLT